MARTTIKTRKAELEMQMKVLNIVERALDSLENECRWNAMHQVLDENGDIVRDDEGVIVCEPPSEEDYVYEEYVAYQTVIRHIEKLLK